MRADSIKIEEEENGFHLIIDGDSPCEGYTASVVDYLIADPEEFYDHVKAAIGPWLYERDMAHRPMAVGGSDPDPWTQDAYDTSDPKHPDFHSVHADIWDNRDKTEGGRTF